MTLRDILTEENYNKYGDMDVYSDCIDDYACCWCGTLLTDYGKDVYVKALDIKAEIRPDNWLGGDSHCILVLTDDEEDYEELWDEAKAFFADMAGYIPDDDYRKRFVSEGEEEPESGSLEAGIKKIKKHIKLASVHMEEFAETLEENEVDADLQDIEESVDALYTLAKYTIHDLECKLNRALICLTNPVYQQDEKEETLKLIGLSEKEIKDWLY